MSRRGFTLLEVLIAIGLALALLALAIPPLTDTLDRRAFESAADTTLNQLLLARAEAQTSGRAVEVVYHPSTRIVEARRFDPSAVEDDLPAPGVVADSRGVGRDADDRSIAEAWATIALPAGLRLTDQEPEPDEDSLVAAPGAVRAPVAAAVSETVVATLRLAAFMPDGSALLGRDFWLIDDAARRASFSMNPWTGLPSVTEGVVVAPPPDAAAEDEEEDMEFDDEPDVPDLDDEPAAPDPDDEPTTVPDEEEAAE